MIMVHDWRQEFVRSAQECAKSVMVKGVGAQTQVDVLKKGGEVMLRNNLASTLCHSNNNREDRHEVSTRTEEALGSCVFDRESSGTSNQAIHD
jgi:hypothetical protein